MGTRQEIANIFCICGHLIGVAFKICIRRSDVGLFTPRNHEEDPTIFGVKTHNRMLDLRGSLCELALMKEIADLIADVPDFPKPGIVFKDITTLLEDPKGLDFIR